MSLADEMQRRISVHQRGQLEGDRPSANETQVGGNHYKSQAIQPWDFILANAIPYMEGNIIKYVTRWRQKGGLGDLKKAKHYLEKLIEVEERKGAK